MNLYYFHASKFAYGQKRKFYRLLSYATPDLLVIKQLFDQIYLLKIGMDFPSQNRNVLQFNYCHRNT